VPKTPLNQLEAVYFSPTGRDFYLSEGLGKNSHDRHVVAAGIAAGASIILTWNLRHFPAKELKKFGLRRETPDVFLSSLYDKVSDLLISSLANA
jgi:hypothetical protein